MCQIKFPRRKWDVMIIHHSHTDIGYTETQSTIERWQVDFVRQALDYIEEINSAEKNDNEVGPGIDQNLAQQVSEDFNEGIYKDKGSGLFKWNIESFWVVEKFLETATRDKIDFFINCIKNGYLGISASYLNNNELLDFDNMNSVLKRSTSFCNEIGHPIDTAMTADINGYGWGFARALIDNKIYNLYTCTHSHHAMYPGNRRQYPFWWETPQGERILVWNGEHYMFGNEMGLVPGGIHRGFIHDGFDTGSMRPLEIMENRLPVYLRQLEMEDYPYNFVPLTVSGLVVDNAPPNKYIPALIQKWNSLYGQHISLRMVTIEQVFKKIRDNLIELPVYRGDWPDWWSDGLSSIANHTKIFRQAQRDFKLYKLLAEKYNLLNQQVEKQVENNLALYAEHTYAYHHSIANPFDFKGLIHLENKKSYSVTVYNDIKQALNKIYSDNEQQALSFNRSLKYKVINPYPCTIEDLVRLPVKTCEFAAGELKPGEFRIIDSNKKCLSFQQDGEDILVKLILCPHEDKTLEIVPEQRKTDALIRSSFDIRGNSYINPYQERATDIIRENSREDSRENSGENTSAESSILVGEGFIESPYVKLGWDCDGIYSWIDKGHNCELRSKKHKYNFFNPVYELTPASDSEMVSTRREMRRNRKGSNMRRSSGKITGIKRISSGKLFTEVELESKVSGVNHFYTVLKVYQDKARVDVKLKFLKESNWQPENLYIALPFTTEAPEQEEIWFNKAGVNIRPGVDQIPGTLTDFYCIQDGVFIIGDNLGIVISMPDTPLVQTGDINYGPRVLQGSAPQKQQIKELYSWVMTNYWETNFAADLGGFYEFNYYIEWGAKYNNIDKASKQCKLMNFIIPAFRI